VQFGAFAEVAGGLGQFGAVWVQFYAVVAVWYTLLQFDAVWCSMVLFGAL